MFIHAQLFCNPCTLPHQAPLTVGFPRKEYWSGLSFPSPGHLPDPGIEPTSPASEDHAVSSGSLGMFILGRPVCI